jgi:hypothetical protein
MDFKLAHCQMEPGPCLKQVKKNLNEFNISFLRIGTF